MLSHVSGPTDQPLLDLTIGQALQAAADTWPDRPALVDRGHDVRLSWRELADRSADLALGLSELGLKRGDRIGIWSLNRHEWTLTQLAAARLGLILVTVNPAYRLAELEYVLENSGCAAIVLAPRFKSSDYLGMIRSLLPDMASAGNGEIHAAALPMLRRVIVMGEEPAPGALLFGEVTALGSTLDRRDLAAIEASLGPHDPVTIQFTSGTTGSPKGVTLSHHNILNNGYFNGRLLNLTAEDSICIPVPLYHCFALTMGNLTCLTHGSTMVYPGEGFSAEVTLAAVAAERCTALYGVPTMFIAQLEHPDFAHYDLTSLRTGLMGGAPCPLEIMRKVIDRMHLAEITIAYGMTETSPASFQSSRDETVGRRVSTVGQVHPHVEAKIVDLEGRTVERGQSGELCVRGYSVMQGYWQQPEQTAAAIDADGWMHTGDLATLDEQGYARIVGRLKDMVIRGGENLYPREIEEFLHRHPALSDVQVFGVPDDHYGEELCAWITVKDGESVTEADVRQFCRGQIAHHKIPRHIRFVETYPMTVTGKAQKFMMREAMQRELDEAAKKAASELAALCRNEKLDQA